MRGSPTAGMPPQSWLFDEIIRVAADALGVAGAGVTVTAPFSERLTGIGSTLDLGRGPAGVLLDAVTRTGTTLVVPDVADDRLVGPGLAAEGCTPARSVLAEPVRDEFDRVVGALCLWDGAEISPTPAQRSMLHRTSAMIAAMLTASTDTVVADAGPARDSAVLAATSTVLGEIVEGAGLPDVLDELVRAVEAALPEASSSILLLDGEVMRHGAAPTLSPDWLHAIDGLRIGPEMGACGTAAYRGATVICSDVASDPLWKNFRELAIDNGIRACWSLPIIAPGGDVLGTFALYFDAPREPRPGEVEGLRQWVNLAQLAILRSRDLTRLRTAATQDPVTGLLNRTEMTRRLRAAAVPPSAEAAVLVLDVDGFKLVNDAYGHHVGDQVLRVLADRIDACASGVGTVSRWGGDEFLVYCAPAPAARVQKLAADLLDAVSRPMRVAGHVVSLSASVGVATSAVSVPSELVADADLAMYTAKHSSRGSVAMFTTELRGAAARRLRLEADLSVALANREIHCAYQPCVQLGSGKLVGVEALARWTSPVMGSVPPVTFVPIAEDAGLIGGLGSLVLHEACRQLARWRRTESRWNGVRTWVNVSPRQLEDGRLLPAVEDALAESGLDYSDLGIEVTESSFVQTDSMSQTVLVELRDRGVHVAIDDFGTGFSSLSQLKNLPVDVLKIDRQFVLDMDEARDPRMIKAIVAFADSLGLAVVVEGVETSDQRRQLLEFSSPLAQGYMWSKPVSGEDLAHWVAGRPKAHLN